MGKIRDGRVDFQPCSTLSNLLRKALSTGFLRLLKRGSSLRPPRGRMFAELRACCPHYFSFPVHSLGFCPGGNDYFVLDTTTWPVTTGTSRPNELSFHFACFREFPLTHCKSVYQHLNAELNYFHFTSAVSISLAKSTPIHVNPSSVVPVGWRLRLCLSLISGGFQTRQIIF